MGGRTEAVRTRVTRVDEGRLIEEVVLDRPMTTTFEVRADERRHDRPRRHEVDLTGRVQGVLERLFAPRMLSGIYADELRRLEDYAASRS